MPTAQRPPLSPREPPARACVTTRGISYGSHNLDEPLGLPAGFKNHTYERFWKRERPLLSANRYGIVKTPRTPGYVAVIGP